MLSRCQREEENSMGEHMKVKHDPIISVCHKGGLIPRTEEIQAQVCAPNELACPLFLALQIVSLN